MVEMAAPSANPWCVKYAKVRGTVYKKTPRAKERNCACAKFYILIPPLACNEMTAFQYCVGIAVQGCTLEGYGKVTV